MEIVTPRNLCLLLAALCFGASTLWGPASVSGRVTPINMVAAGLFFVALGLLFS